MGISVSVSPGSGSVVTETERLGTINATIGFTTDTVPPETITSVTSTTHNGITMTPGTTSCTLVGTYEDSFTDKFKYVEKGSSDLAGSPTTVIGLDNLPSNKLFYNLNHHFQSYFVALRKGFLIFLNFLKSNQFFLSYLVLK